MFGLFHSLKHNQRSLDQAHQRPHCWKSVTAASHFATLLYSAFSSWWLFPHCVNLTFDYSLKVHHNHRSQMALTGFKAICYVALFCSTLRLGFKITLKHVYWSLNEVVCSHLTNRILLASLNDGNDVITVNVKNTKLKEWLNEYCSKHLFLVYFSLFYSYGNMWGFFVCFFS